VAAPHRALLWSLAVHAALVVGVAFGCSDVAVRAASASARMGSRLAPSEVPHFELLLEPETEVPANAPAPFPVGVVDEPLVDEVVVGDPAPHEPTPPAAATTAATIPHAAAAGEPTDVQPLASATLRAAFARETIVDRPRAAAAPPATTALTAQAATPAVRAEPTPVTPANEVTALATPAPAPAAPAARVLTTMPGSNPPPDYPPVARRRGWQGTVVLALEVDAAGAVVRVEVRRSSGHAVLDAAAVAAVRDWRFANGPGGCEQMVEFRLGR
jgi:TonB family protein